MKRGTDHEWEIRKYLGDIALYAHCKCGFKYACSTVNRNMDGSPTLEQIITRLYDYCPVCGARKKRYNPEPKKIGYYPWEER